MMMKAILWLCLFTITNLVMVNCWETRTGYRASRPRREQNCNSDKVLELVSSSVERKDQSLWLMLLQECPIKVTTRSLLAQPRVWQMLWEDPSLHFHLLTLLEKERCTSNLLRKTLSPSDKPGPTLKVTTRHVPILRDSCRDQLTTNFVREFLLPKSSQRAKKILRSWGHPLPPRAETEEPRAPEIQSALISTSAVYLARSGRPIVAPAGVGEAAGYCFLAHGDTVAIVDSKHVGILTHLIEAPTVSIGHLLRKVHRQGSASFAYGWYRYRERSLTVYTKYRIGIWIALHSRGQVKILCDSIWDRQHCTGGDYTLPVADDDADDASQMIIVMGNRKMLRKRPSLAHVEELQTSKLTSPDLIIMRWINSPRPPKLSQRSRPVALITLIKP